MVKKLMNIITNRKNVRSIIILIVTVYFCLPHRYAAWYNYIKPHEMLESLIEKTISNSTLLHISGKDSSIQRPCDYMKIIDENQYFYTHPYISRIHDPGEIKSGGEYAPSDCLPQYSTAIIIPYRNREDQLKSFLTYMHNYLRKQKIHYRIFIVEQADNKPFNRAKLFNIGAVTAFRYGYPCLILHDVDLMPLRMGNIYACTKLPRHMCSSLDKFRYNLPYNGLFGGASAIDSDTFKLINGMSNIYNGWGGEDDDLYSRIITHDINICRFSPKYSSYIMLKHKNEPPNEERNDLLKHGKERFSSDGINSLQYVERVVKLLDLYTLIVVEI